MRLMRDDSDSIFDEIANLKELGGENPSINYCTHKFH